MKHFYLILVFALVIGCASRVEVADRQSDYRDEEIVGAYTHTFPLIHISINLKLDGRYSRVFTHGLDVNFSEGQWILRGNELILISENSTSGNLEVVSNFRVFRDKEGLIVLSEFLRYDVYHESYEKLPVYENPLDREKYKIRWIGMHYYKGNRDLDDGKFEEDPIEFEFH